ncbi:biogenesis of lysosome-related organelles complex 1 subunit 5 isoform X2 [Equus asinus]|uniref:biogenesis of lysosome-related organelles complex 1 subunit 5 isoform X2 n=1 Tax=Equus asinus TaxID=9793 RepID=UPI0038F7EF0F
MSGGGTETLVGYEAATGGGDKKRDSLGTTGSPAHLIIKDLGEIHSRLLDHRPVIQGETRYFVKEFEEKRGLREMRVLENLKNMIHETNEHTIPKCRETMQDNLDQVLQRLHAATDSVCRLQQREQERKKPHQSVSCGAASPGPLQSQFPPGISCLSLPVLQCTSLILHFFGRSHRLFLESDENWIPLATSSTQKHICEQLLMQTEQVKLVAVTPRNL